MVSSSRLTLDGRPASTCPMCLGTGKVVFGEAPPPEDMGARIAHLLSVHEISQAAFGQAIGRTQAAVSYWITGKHRPSYDDLCAIAGFFEVTTDWLIYGAEPMRRERGA